MTILIAYHINYGCLPSNESYDIEYPLVSVYITMENHHAIDGKIHDFDWAIFNSYVSVYQRVYPVYPIKSH